MTTTPPRRYTPEELLSLRASLPVVCCLVKNIRGHPDTSGIFRIPDEAVRRPEQISYKSAHLADIAKTLASHSLGRKNISDSSEQSDLLSGSRASQDTTWGLRRRDISDRSSQSTSHVFPQATQPQTAPTGLLVHRSENFQRFYKAVVSPTHVRVTAGGRIVPNTRSPVRSRLERSSDQPTTVLNPTSWERPLPPAYSPVVQGSFKPQDSAGMSSQGAKATGNVPSASGQQSIKISSPTQFDHTKPFVYNGQLVYPITQGMQPPQSAVPVPFSMLGNTNFYPPAGYLPAQSPLQFAGPPNPAMFGTSQQHPMMATPNMVPSLENLVGAYMSFPTFVAPAESIQSQIQVLCGHLKQIESQLANNKHQIDSVMVENQRDALLAQIGSLEAFLRVYIGQDVANVASQPGQINGLHQSTRSFSHGTPSTNVDATGSARFEQSTKSKLSLTAAMAPPFQPRSRTNMNQQSQGLELKPTSMSTSALEMSKARESQADIEARLISRATSDWDAPNALGLRAVCNAVPQSTTLHENHNQGQTLQVPTLPRHSHFPGQSLLSNATAVPYLVGVLPAEVNVQTASAHDLVYDRPLTDDEVRARYLYWGKAPRSAQIGLPKFDGKDFYPPSPVKIDPAPVSKDLVPPPFMSTARPIEVKDTEDLQFENLFVEKGVPGYRSPPAAKDLGISNLKPATQPVFAKPGMPDELDFTALFTERGVPGYRSPPPKIKHTEVSYSKPIGDAPVTPDNPTFSPEFEDEDDTSTVDSWMPPKGDKIKDASDTSIKSLRSDAQDSESTVDIRLSPLANGSSPKAHPTYDRVDFKSADAHAQFLQNMLRNVTQAPIVGTPVSGTVSSATAQGYLPQYRGSAAASLAPVEVGKATTTNASSTTFNYENRPLSQQRHSRVVDTMTAENYLRYVTQKGIDQEDLKVLNPTTSRMGPVRPGEEW